MQMGLAGFCPNLTERKMPVKKPFMGPMQRDTWTDTNGHPDIADGQSQVQKVCFYWGTQCSYSTTATIQKCDGFYIYKFPNTPSCSLRYCGA